MSVTPKPEAGRTTPGDTASAETWRLRREIDATRGDLDRYIEELQRRRRELMDVKLQMRRHPAIVVGLGVVLAAAVGGAVWKARRARQRKSVSRVGRALSALGAFGNLSGSVSAPPRERRNGRLLGLLADAGVPLGIALAKGLLRRTGNPGSRQRGL